MPARQFSSVTLSSVKLTCGNHAGDTFCVAVRLGLATLVDAAVDNGISVVPCDGTLVTALCALGTDKFSCDMNQPGVVM